MHWIKVIFFHTVKGYENVILSQCEGLSTGSWRMTRACQNNSTAQIMALQPQNVEFFLSTVTANQIKQSYGVVLCIEYFWIDCTQYCAQYVIFYSPSLRLMFYQLVSFKIKGEFNIFIGFSLHILFVCLVLLLFFLSFLLVWVSFLGEERS